MGEARRRMEMTRRLLSRRRNGTNQSAGGRGEFATDSATSRDGTVIGYRRLGRGPGIVLLHGTMSSGQNHVELAETLADDFTVYLPDRRGRPLSGSFGKDYGIHREVEDLDALLQKTGVEYVLGASTGGIVSLEAALTLPVRGVAIWEPPLFQDQSVPAAIWTRTDEEMARGDGAAALVTGMKGAQMGPRIFKVMPRWLLEWLTARFMASEDRKERGDYLPMSALAPTLPYDFQLVVESSGRLERYRAVDAEVLLLGGSRSPQYLKDALDALERLLPRVEHIQFPGLDHAASWNADRGGRPELLAQQVHSFFSRHGQELSEQ
jgi:pimeloyl-ACP methyl ester carboxylesterase